MIFLIGVKISMFSLNWPSQPFLVLVVLINVICSVIFIFVFDKICYAFRQFTVGQANLNEELEI